MRLHQPTIAYVARRTTEGKSKAEIIRCVKRFLAREIYQLIRSPAKTQPPPAQLDDYRSVNAVIESFWARMQTELLDRQRWTTARARQRDL